MNRKQCLVLDKQKIAPGHYVVRFQDKAIARDARPGQFVQILCSDTLHPLLPRPFSFLDVHKDSFDVLFHVVGQGTRLLSELKNLDKLTILGPLGNGFCLKDRDSRFDTRIMVGGGVGIPPLYHLAKTLITQKINKASDIHVFLGARDKTLLLCEKEFKRLKVHFHPSTNNGSRGFKGFVTQDLENFLSAIRHPLSASLIQTCGPNVMMKAVGDIARRRNIRCEVSVEMPMACGFGACLGCAIKVHDDHNSEYCLKDRYAVTCVEGPVFPAESVVW